VTETITICLITAILLATVYLLVTERLPMDLTALGIMAVLMVTGILSPAEALSGFSNPAVIAIAAMFMLARGLTRTGALGLISEKIITLSRGNEKRILILAMIGSALPSAFVNNTPVVVLMISVIMSACCRYGLSPSKYLIPVSYASIMGGTCTLIGTSTNLIASALSLKHGYGAIGMFELSPLGLPITVIILAFLFFTALKVLPDHKAPVCELGEGERTRYLAEFLVPPGSRLIGREPLPFFAETYPTVEIFEVVREPIIHFPEREKIRFEANDLLLVKGSASDLVSLLKEKLVELPHLAQPLDFKAHDHRSLIVELIITPESPLVGEHPIQSGIQEELGVQIIAVKRHGTHYPLQKIRHLRLSVGDVLLVQISRDGLDRIRNRTDFVVLEEVHHQIVSRKKAPLSLAIFAGMVVSASTGLADISVCAVTAAFLMMLTRCLQMRDAYRSMDVKVLLVIIGTIALGTAMEKTGAARLYAEIFLSPFRGSSPIIVLGAFILLTSLVTEFMSNGATAVLLIPIAISTAVSIGVDPKPFIIGVCFGASCGFAVPIGYQTNLLVYGPGGYRFRDFLKLGIPLDILTWLISTMIIPLLWPF
jgi:di/tricarboxylate transporter